VLFSALGADERRVRRAAEQGLRVLRGHRPEEIRAIVADALEPVLRPLVYREPLDLVVHHQARGEPVFIVTTTLQEVADAIADDLGFDGALGTVCEVGPDGTYTGHSLRPMYGEAKVAAARELGYDLAVSTAYSDSHTDLPLLEAVGQPVAVNPDRALRRVAAQRGWPVLRFRDAA
jgi:HAD superfamily hydrolase (TIGR01490 family)